MSTPIGIHDPALRHLIDQVCTARDLKAPLDVRGGGTKAFYGGMPRGEPLDVRTLAGISSLEPTELVVTARAGTLLADLEAALAEIGQCLPFEPPRFGGGAGLGVGSGTVGGMVAAGLAGPARASVGAVRDHVLGATVLNGRGALLTFGGQVMKNVAGYDVSRLMAGAMGVLGVLCEVSLKTMPLPAATTTLEFDLDETQALAWLGTLRAQPLPLSASAWQDGRLRIRLAGARAAVKAAMQQLGGRAIDANEVVASWRAVRDHTDPGLVVSDAALANGECLWRLSLPPTAPALALPGHLLIEWGGQQRWLRTSALAAQVRAVTTQAGGHATLFRAADKSTDVFAPLSAPLMRIHRELKAAFDPERIFNPGRLYPDL